MCWTKYCPAAVLILLSSLFSRRSNSISKSPGPSSPKEPLLLSRDISRSESLRSSSSCSQQIFRPCDLIHGEVLGKGFFGQAIKVRELLQHSSVTLSTAISACLGILHHSLGGFALLIVITLGSSSVCSEIHFCFIPWPWVSLTADGFDFVPFECQPWPYIFIVWVRFSTPECLSQQPPGWGGENRE